MSSLPLKDIITCILKEFESANIAVEVSREYWRQLYESSPLLKEFTPSRIRVAEADISLPLAIEHIGKAKPKPPSLTHLQMLRLMPNNISLEEREQVVSEIISHLVKRRKHSFKNTNLARDVHGLLKRRLPTVNFDPILKGIEKLQQDFMSKPSVEYETEFVYQTAELEKVNQERIARFNLKIVVD